MKSEKYGERRGAAFGLAGVVKGFGISFLKKYRIVILLQEALAERLRSCLLHSFYTIIVPLVTYLSPFLMPSLFSESPAVNGIS